MTRIKDITQYLEQIAPRSLQEDYDNCGLLTGNDQAEVKGVLITLDITEEIILEAEAQGCNLIVAHHPIIFRGLKKLTGSNYVERCVILSIQKNIALFAIHTSLDNVLHGVNHKIAGKLDLKNLKILAPKAGTFMKLVTFVPRGNELKVKKALHDAGAGNIGNYSECSFSHDGIGTFRANDEANPHIGEKGIPTAVEEIRIEVIFPSYLENTLVAALRKSHPYEEPAFDIYALVNKNPETGAGMIGEFAKEMSEMDFLNYLKARMNLKVIRHTALRGKPVKRVALCGGSGSFLLKNAISAQADAFVSADFKYHEFFDADGKIVVADIGHYESEVYTKDLISEFLMKKFSNIAILLSKVNSNPINYLK